MVVRGLWFVVCGLWFVVWGLWFVVCGFTSPTRETPPFAAHANSSRQKYGETHFHYRCVIDAVLMHYQYIINMYN